MSSLAIAASKRGAPVKLCRAAPKVERIIPTYMIAGEGQAMVAVNNLQKNFHYFNWIK